MKDLYAENYTMLMKEVKDLNKRRDILCCELKEKRLNMSIPLKLIDRSICSIYQKPSEIFSVDINRNILKFIRKGVDPSIVKTILQRRIKWKKSFYQIQGLL